MPHPSQTGEAMDAQQIERAAEEVVRCRLAGRRLAKLAGIDSEEAGYAVQQRANLELAKRLGPVAGHKIGGTTSTMRAMLGWSQPVADEVFEGTVQVSPGSYAFGTFLRPGIETEIAVRLGRGLPAADAPFDRAAVAAAVAEVFPAIEIVDDRYEDYRSAGAATVIADNAFNAASVLGRPAAGWRELDLAALEARTWIDGVLVAEARSDALMGHPFEALVWLANRRAALGLGLAAGSFVSLGTITPVQWLAGPAHARIAIEGLGEVVVLLA